jgi:predicted RNA-binding Zn-ribbon protein involved in translation (DUF1610 family)
MCPKCGGTHFGRDTEAIDLGPYPGSQGAGEMSTSEYHIAQKVRILRTVRCHTPKCGWRGDWPPKDIHA